MSKIKVTKTERILHFLSDQDFENSDDDVDLDLLTNLVHATQNDEKPVEASWLMEGAQITKREVILPKPMSEIELIRMKSTEKDYQRKIQTLDFLRAISDDKRKPDTFEKPQASIAAAFNFPLGLFLMFLGGYFAARFCGVRSEAIKLMIGGIFSFIWLIAETGLIVIHDYHQMKFRKKQEREKKLADKKRLTGTGPEPESPKKPKTRKITKSKKERKEKKSGEETEMSIKTKEKTSVRLREK